MADFFAVRPLLKARIEALVGSGVPVHTGRDWYHGEDQPKPAPAVYLFYMPPEVQDDPGGRSTQGNLQFLEQHWLVAVAVDNEETTAAGQLVGTLLEGLCGWTPAGFKPFKFRRPLPVEYRAGIAYMPFDFSMEYALHGVPFNKP